MIEQLLEAYRTYATANAKADASFDVLKIFEEPARPAFTPEAHAGELIEERGIHGALKVAQYGIEDPDCPEAAKEAYSLIIQATQ